MARDAISRQYDVDKNSMTLTCEGEKGSYRPGVITFYAKKAKSLDLDKIRESITATRLSGGTRMSVSYLEITALGDIVLGGKDNVLNVSGTGQQFVLGEDPSAKGILQKLGEATRRGDKIGSVTGRVQGWNGGFPNVLRELAKTSNQDRMELLVTGFEVAKK
jgi:hypothetical protein